MRSLSAHIQNALASGVFIGDTAVCGRVTVEADWYLTRQPGGRARGPKPNPASRGSYTEQMVRDVFAWYGYDSDELIRLAVFNPPPTETAEERIDRITTELNTNRTWEALNASIAILPAPSISLGNWPVQKLPVRWWQRADNSQAEIEIPGVTVINRDKSLDNLAPTCDITILNQKMNPNTGEGDNGELGNPGYYTFDRGHSAEARARWGHVENEWSDVLVQNALIRVYQGFGGADKTIPEAVADGNLMLRFVGLIDDVDISTSGQITLRCRGTSGGLLVDQQVFVPLVPLELYPLTYSRWSYKNVELNARARDVTVGSASSQNQISSTFVPGDRQVSYADSSEARWGYPNGVHGHAPTDTLDGDHETFWLSVGNSGPDREFSTVWIEFDCAGESINAIYIDPWAGDYDCYVSVMENGAWQGDPNVLVPYDPTVILETQEDGVDTGAAIPYVAEFGVPWETNQEYGLPRMYAAQRIRISFRHLTYTEWGPWHYRAGVREFRARISASGGGTAASPAPGTTPTSTPEVIHVDPIFLSAAAHPSSGYVTIDQFGDVDAFGGARTYGLSVGATDNTPSFAVRMSPTGLGYWILNTDGRLNAYGDARHYGDLDGAAGTSLAIDFAPTPSGNGYWIVQQFGQLHAYGDAIDYGLSVALAGDAQVISIEAIGGGVVVMDSTGVVTAFGTATNYGSFTPLMPTSSEAHAQAISLRRTGTGLGYWILTNEGVVQAFGDAADLGGLTSPQTADNNWYHAIWEIIPNPTTNDGFLILRGDGTIYPIGNVDFYGGPASGQAQLRTKGNYVDLVDIVKDLLMWSGYWLREDLGATATPSILGILESTGTYVNSPFAADQFDKKSVADALNIVKEIVGYIIYELDDGGIAFVSPNYWSPGNFDENEQRTNTIPEVDERVDLTGLSVKLPSRPVRSPIIISSEKIDFAHPEKTVHVEYEPPYAGLLRGMCRPAMWVNGAFTEKPEMQIMAELISLHIWFQLRLDNVEAWINPAVEINDQVRIFERQTSETAIHYVRGINDTMDLQQGRWDMRLTTNWLGNDESWAITAGDVIETGGLPRQFKISQLLAAWIQSRGTERSYEGVRTLQPQPHAPTIAGIGSQTGDGQAT